MWIAIAGAFVLVTVLFGQSQHRESSDGSTHPKPAVAEVAEPSSVPMLMDRPRFTKGARLPPLAQIGLSVQQP